MNGIAGISFQETESGLRVHVKKSKKSFQSGKLKKRLPYNFKALSGEILRAKKSGTARPLIMKMKSKLSWLYKQLKNGEYGESEIMAAIIHAATMEKIAKRKVRHLEEEEAAENGNCKGALPGEDEEIYGKSNLEDSLRENEELSKEIMDELMDEIARLEEELTEDLMTELQDIVCCSGRDMSEEEIKEMKQRHRDDEERQLTKADLEYLKSLFNRLEQEKKQNSTSAYNSGYHEATISYTVECIPEIEMADIDVGETIDVSV